MKKLLSLSLVLIIIASMLVGCEKAEVEKGTGTDTSKPSSQAVTDEIPDTSEASQPAEEVAKKYEVKVKIEINEEIVEKTYKTDAESVEALLLENQEELKATFKDSEYGKMITGMNGYTADEAKKEYFELLVDGVSSLTGAKDTKLEDGKVYTIKLSKF